MPIRTSFDLTATKVLAAFLHQPVGVPGFIGANMSTIDEAKLPGISIHIGSVNGAKGLLLLREGKSEAVLIGESNAAYTKFLMGRPFHAEDYKLIEEAAEQLPQGKKLKT